MQTLVIDIFMYIFEAFVLYFYSLNIFNTKTTKKTLIKNIIFVHIILCIVNQLKNSVLNFTLFFFLYNFLFRKNYKMTLKKSVFHVLILISIMLSTEVLSIGLSTLRFYKFNTYLNNINAYIFVTIVSKLLYFIFILLIVKLFGTRTKDTINEKTYWLLFFLPLTSLFNLLFIWYLLFYNNCTQVLSLLCTLLSLFILFSNVLVFYIYSKSIFNISEINKLTTINMQQKIDRKYFDIIEESDKKNKCLIHDIKNHLLQISYMDNVENIHNYTENLISEIIKINIVCSTGNKILDIIISKYETLCEKRGIKFQYNIERTNLLNIKDVDLSSLLNNLLDNAVDAAIKSKEPNIYISIFNKNDSFDGIVIRNSSDKDPIVVKNKLTTKKKNPELHGFGLSIVKSIIEKYDMIYEWKYNPDLKEFETFLAIPKQKKQEHITQ